MSVTLVTGSARGLGRAVAERLAGDGDRVHVVWRSSTELVDRLVAAFGRDRVHQADLEDRAQASALVARVVERDGGLDRVVHAVGGYASGPTSEIGAELLQQLWSSNVATAQHVFDAARPELRRAAHGRAVFFGCAGLAGLRARRTIAAYAAAKSALVVLARSWALEEAPFGVTVNLVSPGLVPHDGAHPDTLDPALQASLPAGRAGRPEEVAEAVRWLVSDAAGYTTGTELLVSGGWLI
ncbi:MAG: SDR family oxidoreductase [Planctomycetota bacterium]